MSAAWKVRQEDITCRYRPQARQLQWEAFLNRRLFPLAFGVMLASSLLPWCAVAADSVAEALLHTRKAIEHAKTQNFDLFLFHVEAALSHADAIDKDKRSSHVENGIIHLVLAFDRGRQKRPDAAISFAEAALTNLEAHSNQAQ